MELISAISIGYPDENPKQRPRKKLNEILEWWYEDGEQITHPVAYKDKKIRSKSNCFWVGMTKVSVSRLDYEEDYFPTAQSMIAEF